MTPATRVQLVLIIEGSSCWRPARSRRSRWGSAAVRRSSRQHEPAPADVKVVESRRMTLPIIVNPIGTTRALEDETIRARVKGFLKEKHFQDGGQVKAGELLLVIDEQPSSSRSNRARPSSRPPRPCSGRPPRRRPPKSPRPRWSWIAPSCCSTRSRNAARGTCCRGKAASQEDFDKAEAQRKKSEAQVQADLAKLRAGLADYKIDIDRAKADIEKAKAALGDAQINLGYCRMYAHIDGRIGELKVKVGSLVGDGGATELVTIQQLDPMGLDFRPPARYLPLATTLLAQGLKVELTVEGDRKHPHIGKAIFIDNVVDNTTSTFLMRAEVPNPDGSLLPGLYIRAGMIDRRVRRCRGRPGAIGGRGPGGLAGLRRQRGEQGARSPSSRSMSIRASASSSPGSSRARK